MKITRTRTAAAAALLAFAGSAAAAPAATAGAAAAPAAAASPACTAASLSTWVNADQASGAAGTIVYPLEFTNIGGHACTIRGYPGVSATSSTGHQLGDAAARQTLYPAATVTVPAGGTVHADLFYGDAEVSTSGCKPEAASLLKVYPPGQKTARTAFFSLPACALTGHVYLRVSVVRPGALLNG